MRAYLANLASQKTIIVQEEMIKESVREQYEDSARSIEESNFHKISQGSHIG